MMVSISGAPHLRYAHDILGALTIILIICTLLPGYLMNRKLKDQTGFRSIHRWLGRILIILVAVNIILGISMMTTVMA